MGKKQMHKQLVGKPEGKRALERTRKRRENQIKIKVMTEIQGGSNMTGTICV